MSDDTTAEFRPCATCGGDLRINEPVDGLIFTIRDNRGEHHSACWGKPQRDAIASARNAALEEAAAEMDHREQVATTARDSYLKINSPEDAARHEHYRVAYVSGAAAIRERKDK